MVTQPPKPTLDTSVRGEITATTDDVNASGTDYRFRLQETPPAGWGLSTATVQADIPTQSDRPRGVTFKPDGTKLFEVDEVGTKIYAYELSTPWDITTATPQTSIASQDGNPTGIAFSPDGDTLLEVGPAGGKIYESELSTPWDITTAQFQTSIASQDGNPRGIALTPDGDTLLEVGAVGEAIYEYDLTTSWDITTAQFQTSIASQDGFPTDVALRPDGTALFEVGFETIYEYELTTPADITTAQFQTSVSTAGSATTGIAWRPDGTQLFQIDGTDSIFASDVGPAVTDVVVPGLGGGGTVSATFDSLLDGTEYEVRVRAETDSETGTFSDPATGTTTAQPPGSLSVTGATPTSLTLTWDDDAIGNDAYRVFVAEQRLGQFRQEQRVATLPAYRESYTAALKPDTQFRVRVATVADATAAATATGTTDDLATGTAAAGDVPASGPYLEIDHPSNGRTVTPDIIGEVAPCRALNELPTTTVEVRGDKWLNDVFVGADVRLYIDGRRQPADTLVRPTATPEGAELQLRGGSALLKRVETTVVEQEADDFVRGLLQTEASGINQNVDDPDSTTRADTPVASASAQTEWEDILRNYPFGDSDPRTVQNGTLQTERVAAYEEGENGSFENTAGAFFAGRFASGAAAQVEALADAVEITVDVAYPIPSGRSEVRLRLGYLDATHPGFDIFVDGSVQRSITADSDFLSTAQGGQAPRWTAVGIDLGGVTAGSHTIRIEVTAAASDESPLFVDAVTIYDSDFTGVNTTETVSNGGRLSTPELHPTVDVLTDDIPTVRQVVGGDLSSAYNNTLRNQQVAISNDQGSNYLTADNSDTVGGAFATGTSQIRGRFTLSAYSTAGADEPEFNAGQTVSSFDLRADLDTAPLLVDQAYDAELRSILNDVADFADAIWEVRYDQSAGSQVVEWTFPGQREASGDPSVIDFETSVDASSIVEKAVVYGTSKRVSDEELTATVGTAVALDNDYNQPADITVTSADGSTTFERGADYEFNPQDGTITALSGGAINDGQTVLVDYRTRVRGVFEAPSFSGDETLATTETIPAATTDRSAESAALILVEIASEPITSADVVIEDLNPGTQLVEVVSFVDLPTDASFEVYGVANDGGRIRLRLGTRDTVDAVVSRLQSRLEATASKI